MTSSDSEMLTSMIGAEILKTNTIWRTYTVEDVETPQGNVMPQCRDLSQEICIVKTHLFVCVLTVNLRSFDILIQQQAQTEILGSALRYKQVGRGFDVR